MMIKNIMSSPVYLIAADEPISRARNLMLKHSISRLVVIEKKEFGNETSEVMPIGIVTKTDLSYRLQQAEPKWRRRPIDNIPVEIVMTPNPINIYPEASPKQAADLMLENNISGIPVVRSESDMSLVGIVTKLDIIRYYSNLDEKKKVTDIMSPYFITVHRHHTISHVMHEIRVNELDRAIVLDDNNQPVGIITKTNLAFSKISNPADGLLSKEIKMARKNRIGGEKLYRYVKEVSLVAEDIMSGPVITLSSNSKAVEAARIMDEDRINGIPIMDDKIIGIVTAPDILRAVHELE